MQRQFTSSLLAALLLGVAAGQVPGQNGRARGEANGANAMFTFYTRADYPPSAPTDLQVSDVDSTRLSLSWPASVPSLASRSIDHYDLLRNGVNIGQTKDTQIIVSYSPTGPMLEFFSVRAVDNKGIASTPTNEILAPRALGGISIETKLVTASRARDGFVGLLGKKLYNKGTYSYHADRTYDWYDVYTYTIHEDWSIVATYDPDLERWAINLGNGGSYMESVVYHHAPSDPPTTAKWVLDDPTHAQLVTPDGTRIPHPGDGSSGLWSLGDRGTYTFRNYVLNDASNLLASAASDTFVAWPDVNKTLTLEDEIPDEPFKAGAAADYAIGLGLLPALNWGETVQVSFGTPQLTVGAGGDFGGVASRVDSDPTTLTLSGGEYRLHISGTGTRTVDWVEVTTYDDGSPPTVAVRHESIDLDQAHGYSQTYSVSPPVSGGSTSIRILTGQISIATPSLGATAASPQRLYRANDLFSGESGTITIVPGAGWFTGDGTNSAMITYDDADGAIRLVAVDPGAIGRGGDIGGAVASGYDIPSGTDLMMDVNKPGFTNLGGWFLVAVGLKPGVATLTVTLGSSGTPPIIQNATVTVFPTNRLAVDANRDGAIHDDDVTAPTAPYRFWLNDDDDERVMRTWTIGSTYTENEQDDKEVTRDTNKDCNNLVIDTERDLEDLARLWIYTAGITDALKDGTLRLGLKWTDVSDGTPAIRLFKAVEADGGNKYLFTPATASAQVDQTAATGAHGMAVGNLIQGTNPVPLPTALFANLSESQPKTYLLFEGARAGKGQLKLVILDQNDQPIGEGPGVWIELKEPHEFVERYTCGDQSLGTVGALTHYTPSAIFGVPTTEDEKDYVLYVHGYNMEDPEKQRWIETAFKRLYLLGYKGRVGGFSWPCAFGLIDQIRFDESEERAWQAGVRLLEHLQNLKNAGYRVHVIAHSQGNIVTGEALRLWRAAGNATALVNTYLASQAAVAAHSYNAAAPLMPDYEQTTPNVYAVYWRAGDSARFPQTWPAINPPYFADSIMQTTAGRWVNFYNPQDYALTAANGGIGSWESDQRLKPDNFYNWSVTNGFFKGLVPFETSYSFPDDRYTIFSFCAEARSVAVGANATGGVFGSNTRNLQDFGYAAEHLWHSGQFRSFNAARYRYWQAVMSACDLTPYNPN